jgi:hypothetical protein
MTTCKGCGEPCRVISVDFGIGAYEYWGAPGYDSRIELVSDCCEADYDGEEPEYEDPRIAEIEYERGY